MDRRAIVIGGGIGGLLAASVLSRRFERVTILERCHYPCELGALAPPARNGAPQSRCLHMLMAGGAAVFDELVPGWRHEMLSLGAVPFDAAKDTALRFAAGWLPRFKSGITMYACSRALLEEALRRCLSGWPALELLEASSVHGLVGQPDGSRITGVRVVRKGDTVERIAAADLVVDASGLASALPRWLEVFTAKRVTETSVTSGRQYVSRWYHLPAAASPDWQLLAISPAPGEPRCAMMLRAEGERWGVVLLSPSGWPLPDNDEAFLAFTEKLGNGRLREALAPARPVSPIYQYGHTVSRMRHYERIDPWPKGLVVLGDSVCALDPYYGLGMTASARAVRRLREYVDGALGDDPAGSAGVCFQRSLVATNAEAWQLATGRGVDGRVVLRRDRAALRRVYDAVSGDTESARSILSVQHMLSPPASTKEEMRQ